jgi:hypothetical protein
MHIIQKNKIQKLLNELELAKDRGYIHSLYEMVQKSAFDKIVPVGVEILFSKAISEKQVFLMKEYIENTYEFFVDASSLYTQSTQIIIVRYGL